MKLVSVFEDVLEEGVRFGRKEIRLVNSMAQDIKLGFEWEYHVNRDELDREVADYTEEDIVKLATELMNKDIQKQKIEYTNEFIQDQMDAYQVEDGTNNLNTIKKLARDNMKYIDSIVKYEDEFEYIMSNYESADQLDDDDRDTIREYLYSVSTLHPTFNFINDAIQALQYEDQLDSWIHLISGGNRSIAEDYNEVSENADSFFRWSTRLVDGLQNMNMRDGFDSYDKLVELYNITGSGFYLELYPTQEWIERVSALVGDDDTWDLKIKSEYTLDAVNAWDENLATNAVALLDYNPHLIDETPFWSVAERQLSGGGASEITANDYVDYIREVLLDKRNKWGIDSNKLQLVETEANLEDGVETISKPLKLHDGLDLNERMFNHIQDVGWTDDATGLHINVSLRGMNFRRDNFNKSKLLLLLQPKMLKEFFGLRMFIDDQFDVIDNNFIFNAAGMKNEGMLIRYFEEFITDDEKHRQVSFNGFKHIDDINVAEDRIEFRYVGGKDYEHRQKTIEWNIQRMVYLTVVAFSEGFAQKEYLKEMFRILNLYSEKLFVGMSFRDIAEWRKHNPRGSVADIYMDAAAGNRRKEVLHKKISGRRK